MPHNNNSRASVRRLLAMVPVNAWIAIILLVAGGIALWVLLGWTANSTTVSAQNVEHTALTPTQIKSIESIGQWEFLSVSDEEIVDTVKRGFFGDSELTRIYMGTLRLGIDLRQARTGWLQVDGDTLRAQLPPIQLLSDEFIDEARTRTFFESGTWTSADRKQLYLRAQRAMRQRVMSAENISSAQQTALKQMAQLLHSMGFEAVSISFAPSNPHKTK